MKALQALKYLQFNLNIEKLKLIIIVNVIKANRKWQYKMSIYKKVF